MNLPLLFSFKELVMGNGYMAGVRMCGRALLEEDGDEIWITGVNPVGLAGGGLDRNVAFTNFRNSWAEILFDIAGAASSFEEFKGQSESFLASVSEQMTGLWNEALKSVRESGYVDPSLPTEPADNQGVAFEVVDITHSKLAPGGNEVERGVKAAA